VTVDALSTFRVDGVKVMSFGVVGWLMATQAQVVTHKFKFTRMWMMTVAASHIMFKHFALHE